jgi:hypothetical protein
MRDTTLGGPARKKRAEVDGSEFFAAAFMAAMKRRRDKRIRKRKARERRATIKRYRRELQRAAVPPSTVDQAAALIAIRR